MLNVDQRVDGIFRLIKSMHRVVVCILGSDIPLCQCIQFIYCDIQVLDGPHLDEKVI